MKGISNERAKEREDLFSQGLRRCTTCNEIKSLSSFGKSKCVKDGYRGQCGKCRYQVEEIQRKPPRSPDFVPSKGATNEMRKERAELLAQNLRRCRSCGQVKSLHDFDFSSHMKDGYRNQCKKCRLKDELGTPEQRQRAYIRIKSYEKTEKGKRMRQTVKQRWKQNHPDKHHAHIVVMLAKAKGTLPRASTQACQQCGAPASEYHHANGYDENHILDVVPLCRSCHQKVHGATNCPLTAPS